MKINTYKDLIAWQKAIHLTKEVYKISSTLPESEKFNLVSQMNRAVVSVPPILQRDGGVKAINSYLHFLKIARGSLYELETQTILLKELKFFTEEKLTTIFELNN
ncbi:MAG: four helix bundle protein [Bacteroidetes bacterium]|nr:four helix bundle protein [Bacteroidota bacterium]